MNENNEKCPNCGVTMTKNFCLRCGYQKQQIDKLSSEKVSSNNETNTKSNKGLGLFIIALINVLTAPVVMFGIFYFIAILSIFEGANPEPHMNINMQLLTVVFNIYIIISLFAVIKTYITCLKNATKRRRNILIVVGTIAFLFLFQMYGFIISLIIKARH